MDIYKVFKEYGDVDEVVVLAKRNKRGKKFGFVRFFEKSKKEVIHLEYNHEEEEFWKRFNNAFMGEVENVGMTYNIQYLFQKEGFFCIKVTPLGGNLRLLEGRKEGAFENLVTNGASWLQKWFKEVRKWELEMVDGERVTWLQIKMDVMRFLIRTRYSIVTNESLNVNINGSLFKLKLVEDTQGPMRILMPGMIEEQSSESKMESDEGSDEEDDGEEAGVVLGFEEDKDDVVSQSGKNFDVTVCMNMDKNVNVTLNIKPKPPFFHDNHIVEASRTEKETNVESAHHGPFDATFLDIGPGAVKAHLVGTKLKINFSTSVHPMETSLSSFKSMDMGCSTPTILWGKLSSNDHYSHQKMKEAEVSHCSETQPQIPIGPQ
ncbi:hypothetical protein KIW84_056664 [Lathyrus oleraceus]|uniref:RRM domain-containing protein n=1 Tax=Pisum sativum TaxID=3888 RepID=A0A9D4X238_PEA|nr:hypothetical protein KIW84_056664 [Pisum sativum]